MENNHHESAFIPALSKQWLTPLYDPLLRWVMREVRFKSAVVRIADPREGEHILDVGCGTGTLSIMLSKARAGLEVVGVDVDRDILDRAIRKADRQHARVQFNLASATELPYDDRSFDKAVSCLVFHHLHGIEGKQAAANEVFRILKPGGRFVLADFGKPTGRIAASLAKFVGHFEETEANLRGELPEIMLNAGFSHVVEAEQFMSVVGSLSLYMGWRH